jgi:hypothetical protein
LKHGTSGEHAKRKVSCSDSGVNLGSKLWVPLKMVKIIHSMGFDFYPIFYPLEVSGVKFRVSGIKMSKTKLKLCPAESLMIGFHHIFDLQYWDPTVFSTIHIFPDHNCVSREAICLFKPDT